MISNRSCTKTWNLWSWCDDGTCSASSSSNKKPWNLKAHAIYRLPFSIHFSSFLQPTAWQPFHSMPRKTLFKIYIICFYQLWKAAACLQTTQCLCHGLLLGCTVWWLLFSNPAPTFSIPQGPALCPYGPYFSRSPTTFSILPALFSYNSAPALSPYHRQLFQRLQNTLLYFSTFIISSKLFGSSMEAVSVRVLCDSVCELCSSECYVGTAWEWYGRGMQYRTCVRAA